MNTTILKKTFERLEPSTLDTLRAVARRRTYPAETTLCRQGEIEDTFYIMVDGQVAIIQAQEDGREELLGIRRVGDYFGELSLLDETPRMANCVTLTETTVLEITQQIFGELLQQSPAVAYAIVRHVVKMLHDNDQRAIEELAAKNSELTRANEELRLAHASLLEKERMERDLEIAAGVQRSLLPRTLPQFADYRLSCYLRPARQVGGDFYDVIALDDEHVALLLADVVDKSVQAALIMAVTRTLFRTESRRSLSPATVAHCVHRSMLDISEDANNMFVTAFYGVLQRKSACLTFVLAGHERPLLFRGETHTVEPLSGHGRFLGMLDPLEIDEYSVTLAAGDRLLIFSDGVPDAANANHERYGYERLQAILQTADDVPAERLLEHIAADIRDFSEGAPLFDDLTMLLAEVAPEAAAT
ncbi:MAG: PP2C family protein-serine/threonine phosphatase [Chloroflexota bacterium]